MSEVQKLISEEERYIADKHSLVSNLVAQIKNFLSKKTKSSMEVFEFGNLKYICSKILIF